MKSVIRRAFESAVFVAPFCFMSVAAIPALGFAEGPSTIKDHPPIVLPPEIKGQEEAVLTDAPNVPPPIKRDHPTKVIVNLEVSEVTKRLADGVEYTFWTFGGSVPGKFIRVREGDFVEFNLANHPSSKNPHNIDLHAVTGPGGGATSSFTAPGHKSKFSFRVINPGLYVYHCATAPVGLHVANGMYGLILVEPKAGLPPVDHEFYVMQGEIYTVGKYGEEGIQPFDMQKAIDEHPPYVVFNGAVGSMVGDAALKMKVGDSVRLFVGNGGPNLISSFHVIGEIFDSVYMEGGTLAAQKNVQTTIVPAGGSAIVDFKTEVPGTYIIVDHSLFRAFNKGALGMIKADGPDNLLVYSGKEVDETYLGEFSTQGSKSSQKISSLQSEMKKALEETPKISTLTKELQIEKGKRVYLQNCAACHQAGGEGLPGVFPPLAKSDYLMADTSRAIRLVLKGLSGPVTVNSAKYDGVMPALGLNDEQIANVITYIQNSWGNSAKPVKPGDVLVIRSEKT